MSRPTWTRRSRRCCRRAPSWRRIRRRFWPRSTSRTSCSRRGRASARSPPGSPRSRTTWRSCFPRGSARRSSGSCRRVSLRRPRGAVLEIDPMTDVLGIVAGLLGGGIAAGVAFYALGRRVERRTADAAARAAAAESERLLADARQRVVLAAREELMQARETFEQEAARRRRESERREQVVEQRLTGLEERARGLEQRGRALDEREQALAAQELGVRARLEHVAGLTAQEAKQELLRHLEDEARNEAAALARDLKEQARRTADKEAKKILALAIQRLAPESTAETTVSTVALPSDEMKGVNPQLVKLGGRMRYRTSYGQNILEHSKEVAWLAGIIATELKLDTQLAKRGALLHDVGKVLTHEHDGTHVQLGVEVATKHGEHPTVINCIAAHHDDVAHESPISVIVQAADAVSGSRPGARREAFETYVKRLTQLEQIAGEFAGVEKVFAIQAGREVRVVVTPNTIDDGKASELSEQIARKIERELQYPGQIKVVVIRETRAVDFAR